MRYLILPEDLPCYNCIHRTGDKICKAFPNGIPDEFDRGINIHHIKHPAQVGDFLLEKTEEYKIRRANRSRIANETKKLQPIP